jgi:hypothetical protein
MAHGDDLAQMRAVGVQFADILVMGEVFTIEVLDGAAMRGQSDVTLVFFRGESRQTRRFLDLDDGEPPGHERKAKEQHKQQQEHATAHRAVAAELNLSWKRLAHGFLGVV